MHSDDTSSIRLLNFEQLGKICPLDFTCGKLAILGGFDHLPRRFDGAFRVDMVIIMICNKGVCQVVLNTSTLTL